LDFCGSEEMEFAGSIGDPEDCGQSMEFETTSDGELFTNCLLLRYFEISDLEPNIIG
jgi:hypothetical protein